MEYGKLDLFCHRIRNEIELDNIIRDIRKYQETKDTIYIQKYLSICEGLLDCIDNENYSCSLLAMIIYDELHPLSDKDKKRWRNYMLRRLQRLNIK